MNSSFNDYKTPVSSQHYHHPNSNNNNTNNYYYSHSRKIRSHSEESPIPPVNPLQNKKAFLKRSIRPQSALTSYSRKNDWMNKSTSYNQNKQQQLPSEIDSKQQLYATSHLEMCADAIRLESAMKKQTASWQRKSQQKTEQTTNKKSNNNSNYSNFDPSSSLKQQQQQQQLSTSSSAQKLTPEQYKQCRLAQFLSRTEDSLKKTIDAQTSLETTQNNLTDCISQAKQQLQTAYENAILNLDKERCSMLLWLESIQNSNNKEITQSTSSLSLLRNELEQFKLDVSSNIEDIILHMQTRPFDEIIRKYLSRIAEIDDLRDRNTEQASSGSTSSYQVQLVSLPTISMLPPPYLPSIVQVNKNTYPLHNKNNQFDRNLQSNQAATNTSKLYQSAQLYNSHGHKGGNCNKLKAFLEKPNKDNNHNNSLSKASKTGNGDSINAQVTCNNNNRAESPWELQNHNSNFGRKCHNKNQQSQSFSSSQSVYPTHFSSQITCNSDMNHPSSSSIVTDTHFSQSSQFDNNDETTPTTTLTFANNSQCNNADRNNKKPNSLQKRSDNNFVSRSYDQQQQQEQLKEDKQQQNRETKNQYHFKQLNMNSRSVDISTGCLTTSCGYSFVPHSGGGVSKKKIVPCELEMAKPYELNNQPNSLREQQIEELLRTGKEHSMEDSKEINQNTQQRAITGNTEHLLENPSDSQPQGAQMRILNRSLKGEPINNGTNHDNNNGLSRPHHTQLDISSAININNQPINPYHNNKQTIESSHRVDLISKELSRRSQFESLHENFGQSINEFISEEPQSLRMQQDQLQREEKIKERYIQNSGQSRQQQCKQAQHSVISQSIKINSAFNSSLSHFQSSTIDKHNISGNNSNSNKSQLNGFTLSQEGDQSSSVYSEVLRAVQPKQHRNGSQSSKSRCKSIHNNSCNSQYKRHNKSSNTKTHNSSQFKQLEQQQQRNNNNSLAAGNDSHFDSMQTDFNDNEDKENLHVSNTDNNMMIHYSPRVTREIFSLSKLLIQKYPLGAFT